MTHSIEKLSRRHFLQFAGTAAAAGVLVACGAKPPVATEAPQATAVPATAAPEATDVPAPTEAAPEGDKITVEYWSAWGPAQEDVLNRMADRAEERHGFNVNLVAGGPGGGDFHEILLARISAGNPPDMATIWTAPVSFGLTGALTVLNDYMNTAEFANPEGFFKPSIDCCSFRGNVYSLPHSNQAAAILYNATWFEEKGISPEPEDFPKTWDDLKALSAQFVEWADDTKLNVSGLIPFMPNEYTSQWLLEIWYRLNGGMIYDYDAVKYDIANEKNVEVMEYWLAWMDEQYKGNVDNIAASGNWSDLNDESGLLLGQSAMVHAGQWTLSYASIKDFVTNNRMEMVKLPVGPGGSKTVNASWPNYMAVPTGAAHPDLGFLLAEAMSTYSVELWYAEIFDLPSWKDFPYDVLSKGVVDNFGQERALEINKFWFDIREEAIPQWCSPVQQFADDTINATFDQIMHKVAPPKDALAEAQAAVQAQLEQTLAGV